MTMPARPGNCPIVATPFTADGAVDHESLESELRFIADAGCEAATFFGIASEFYKLSDAEKDRLVEVATDACAALGLSPVISVTHDATVVAVDRARQYEAAGADCVMVFPPYFMGPGAEGVLEHVRAIGEAVSVPVMVQHTSLNADIDPETWADLHREVPNVRYFKIEVDPPGPYISELLEATDGEVTVLVGNAGWQLVDAYDRGAEGVMPAAVYEELYCEIDRRYREGDRAGARDLHDRLLGALNDFSGTDSSKHLLAERGIIATPHCREPTSGIGDEVRERLLMESHERVMGIVAELGAVR
ncbi:MAG: dihydrodipicolinate synthase family protein [Halobacteriaceae archaeon]